MQGLAQETTLAGELVQWRIVMSWSEVCPSDAVKCLRMQEFSEYGLLREPRRWYKG